MGATTWNYFAPYDKDVAAALQRLREETFRAQKYQRFVPTPEEMEDEAAFNQQVESMMSDPEKTFFPKPGEDKDDWAARVHGQLEQILPKGSDLAAHDDDAQKPIGSIEELLEKQGESGTHSILDIQHISEAPEFRAVSPMPLKELKRIFGTDKPTRKMVEARLGDYDLVEHPLVSERWQGIYFAIYCDDEPDGIFFMGTSGD